MSEGMCFTCGEKLAMAEMSQHLAVCEARAQMLSAQSGKKRKTTILSLFIDDLRAKDHWLIVEIGEQTQLKVLDGFLRDIWLECCNHASEFTNSAGPVAKNTPLIDALVAGNVLSYSYDKDAPTKLRIRACDRREGDFGKTEVIALARNVHTPRVCEVCGKVEATLVCSECLHTGHAHLCAECASSHACGRGPLRPIVNSPRCGVCWYEGSKKYANN